MSYDQVLGDRLRQLLAAEAGVSEQPMFGGLGFLVDGNLAISASGQGGLLVRVEPDEAERLAAAGRAEVAVMGGRRMNGWLRVGANQVRTERQLATWVRRGVSRARALPAKSR